MQNLIENQLFELQKAANRYKSTDPLADWVLFAISRHIYTGRSTRAFDKAFIRYKKENFVHLIAACLNGDKSDEGIIKTAKKILRTEKEEN